MSSPASGARELAAEEPPSEEGASDEEEGWEEEGSESRAGSEEASSEDGVPEEDGSGAKEQESRIGAKIKQGKRRFMKPPQPRRA